jgi:ABC-type amino acid transport substrate-binding protein
MRARCWLRVAVTAALLVVGSGCRSEPSPTVQAPPNPTSAPATTLAGCVVDQGPAAPTNATGGDYNSVQPGVLVAGSVPNLPPFETVQHGQPLGFDVDLMAEVARRLGLTLEVQTETPQSLLTDVASGRTDLAISALSIRADRRGTVDFTDPYFSDDLALTMGVEQSRGFSGIGALAGKAVGVAAGSFGETCARTVLQPQAKLGSVVPYTDTSKAFTDLAVGRLGAVLADVPTADRLIQAVPGLQMVQIYRTNDRYGIAVSKSNPNLRAVINRTLADMRRDGTYDVLFKRWFQVPPPG